MKKILEIPKQLALILIKIYQKLLSFDHSFWSSYTKNRICLHQPSCSAYTYEAIDKFGLIKGGMMGLARIMRCNPWTACHYDPVPENFSLKANCDANNL